MPAHSLQGSNDIRRGASKYKKETKRGDLREQNHQKPNGTIAKACGVIEFKALLTLYPFEVTRKCIIQARLMMTFFQRSTCFSDNTEDEFPGQIPALYLAIFKKDIFFFSLFFPILDPVHFADNGTKYSIKSYTQQVTNQII